MSNKINLSKLPKADYTEQQIKCPECGWHGDNHDDTHATFHEMIETCYIEDADSKDFNKEYLHCTACGTDFVSGDVFIILTAKGESKPFFSAKVKDAKKHIKNLPEGITYEILSEEEFKKR
jgi:NMD protein affecting ribosome stability and mRNA decay